MNKGTNAAMIAASPPLIYSTDQVSNPLAIHNNENTLYRNLFQNFPIRVTGILL